MKDRNIFAGDNWKTPEKLGAYVWHASQNRARVAGKNNASGALISAQWCNFTEIVKSTLKRA